MLLMPPSWLLADHSSMLSLRRLLNLSHYSIYPLHFAGIMRLLAIKFFIYMRKIIVTMWKIATDTFLDTGCLMLILDGFLFGQKSVYLVGGQGRAKFFDWGHYPMPPGFMAALCPPVHTSIGTTPL